MSEHKPVFNNRQLFQLIWPLIIEQLLSVFVGMVDVLMVSAVGESAVSGVSLVDSINILIIQVLGALSVGGTVVCARCIGAKDSRNACHAAAQLILITVSGALIVMLAFLAGGRHFLGFIFGQVDTDVMDNAIIYMLLTSLSFPFLSLYNSGAALFRAMGNSKISMKISLLMNGMNIAGNALCIFVLKMGVSGVALPTLAARAFAAIAIIILLQNPENSINIRHYSDFRPSRKVIHNILSIGIPNGIESGMFQFGKLTLQSLVSTLGTASIAGYAVACNLVTYLYLPGIALGNALTAIVGQCLGAGEEEQAKKYARKLLVLNYSLLAALCSVMIIGRSILVGFYNLSPEASGMAQALVFAHSIAMILWPVAFLLPHYFRASGHARFTMVIAIFSMWVFRVGLAYVFVKILHAGILSIWYAMFIDWIFRFIVFLARFYVPSHNRPEGRRAQKIRPS